jgi:UDP-GlcNAc3NAcA epimerase
MRMIKIVTIIGARPQIIKTAAMSRAIKNNFSESIHEIIIHTGQHYDDNMSEIFFSEMGIPAPDYNLSVGSSSHGVQTARMMEGIEEILLKEKPDYTMIYGDTNSTLAGSVVSAKVHIPVIHIEAGLRSFNKSMPEEINRIVCDHVSTLLFSPTHTGVNNLQLEGIGKNIESSINIDNPRVFHCGDIMYDNSIYFSPIAEKKSRILDELMLENNKYLLVTIHRDNNTDMPDRLRNLFEAVQTISEEECIDVVLPLHPRTSKLLKQNLTANLLERISKNKLLRIIPPVSFFDMMMLEKNCRMIFTDSGGVQKEAFFYQKPCVILRSETEWTEIVDAKCGIVADADQQKIIAAYEHYKNNSKLSFPQIFGDGKAAEFICEKIIEFHNN